MASPHLLVSLLKNYLLSLALVFMQRDKLDMPAQRAYCDFADQRPFLGIPNFMDVASNLIFVLAAAYQARERPLFAVFVLLVALGSGHFHYTRTIRTLIWDRVPMVLAFGLVVDRIVGMTPVFILFGELTLLLWHNTGNLLPYAAHQMATVLFMLVFGNFHNRLAALLSIAAKVAEDRDREIFHLSQRAISGHTLKHILAGLAAFCVAY